MMKRPVTRRDPTNFLRPGEIRPRPTAKRSQAHPGIAPLHPVNHRNVRFQPLPPPLGLPPYHYDLAEHFPEIETGIKAAKKLVFHVAGDTGGVFDRHRLLSILFVVVTLQCAYLIGLFLGAIWRRAATRGR